jgi:hypothetical protein
MHMACVQTSNKSQWCYPRGYKNCVFAMDVAEHNFNFEEQLCEQPPGLFLQRVCLSVM